LFVKNDCPFAIEDISSILQCASLKAMQVQLRMRDYHQLFIYVQYASYPILEKLIGMRENTNITAQ